MATQEIQDLYRSDILPQFSYDEPDRLKKDGFFGLGVIAFIFDHHGRVLMLEHAATEDRPQQLLGPVSEKSRFFQYASDDGSAHVVRVESAAETLRRGIEEELHVGDTELGFEIVDPGYHITERRLHDGDPLERKAKAVVAVMRALDSGSLIARSLPNDDEILSADYYNLTDLLTIPEAALRPGTADFLWQIAENPVYRPFIRGDNIGQFDWYRLGLRPAAWSGLIAADMDFTRKSPL